MVKKTVKKKGYPHLPDYATPPGLSLKSRLRALEMSQKELAARTDLNAATISQIITGKAPVTPDVAQRLENAVGMRSILWLRMEAEYQDQLAKLRAKAEADKQASRQWVRRFPYAELAKRGFVDATQVAGDRFLQLLRFFGVSSPESWEALCKQGLGVTFRRSPSLKKKPELTSAWIRMAQLESEKAECDDFSKTAFKKSLKAIRELTVRPPEEFAKGMTASCAEAGVALVLVPKLSGAGITAATFWHYGRPVIAMTIRGRWSDIFWFSFFHEAGHVLLHSKKEMYISTSKRSGDGKEDEADEFAGEVLIPPKYDSLLSILAKGRSKASAIRAFAEKIGIHPGIIVGRLQHDGLLPYNTLLTKKFKTRLVWAKQAD